MEKKSGFRDPNINPCIKESKLSQKCLADNRYDYSMCTLLFENYNNCKKFWGMVKKQRFQAGIKPTLPSPEEREKILKEREKGNFVFVVK